MHAGWVQERRSRLSRMVIYSLEYIYTAFLDHASYWVLIESVEPSNHYNERFPTWPSQTPAPNSSPLTI